MNSPNASVNEPDEPDGLARLPEEDIRRILVERTMRATKLQPREAQLACSTALIRKKDVVMFAATGFGKTLAFVMPAFASKKIRLVVLSPLNALEDEQVQKFNNWGLSTTAVNAASLRGNPRLIQEINSGRYQVVITSPENAISSSHLKPYLTQQSRDFQLIIIVDEAHLIKKWGESGFRKAWAEIGMLRAFVLPGTAFAAFSATLTPDAIEHVKRSLHMHPQDVVFIKLGNFRPNVIWDVKHISGTKTAIPEVAEYLPPITCDTTSIPLTIIFTNTRNDGHEVYSFIADFVPPALKRQVQLFHALRSQRSKDKVLDYVDGFKCGIFICTEAAAMGCDFPDCERVIQFLVPDDMDTWIQRGGRGGRSGAKPCRSTILVQPSVTATKKVTRKNGSSANPSVSDQNANEEGAGVDFTYQKNIQDVLRNFITTDECLWKVVDQYYQNPPHEETNMGCCYNCERQSASGETASASDRPNYIGINSGYEPKEYHHNDFIRAVSEGLTKWRKRLYKTNFRGSYLPIESIMSDKALYAISKANSNIHSLADFANLKPLWHYAETYGHEALKVIQEARNTIYEHYRAEQEQMDQARKAKEDGERERKRRKGESSGGSGRVQQRLENVERKRKNDMEKLEAYTAQYERTGRRPRGRPPGSKNSKKPEDEHQTSF